MPPHICFIKAVNPIALNLFQRLNYKISYNQIPEWGPGWQQFL